MVVLRFEYLEFDSRQGSAFWLASQEAIEQLERIDGPSRLTYVVYGATTEHAMQQHYDRQGWGAYEPIPGVTDQPFSREELLKQLADYPDDAELRRLNPDPA